MTVEEFVQRLEDYGWKNNEAGTLGLRHAHRIIAGEFTADQLRPATVRLIEGCTGRPIRELLSSPGGPSNRVESPEVQKPKAGRSRSPLAVRRRRMGFTQESFAEAIGVESTTVGRWERGQHIPTLWMQPKIAKALKITTDELVRMIDPPVSDLEGDEKRKNDVAVYWSNVVFADRGVVEVGSDHTMPVNRRSFLSLAGMAAVDMGVAKDFTASIAGGDAEPLVHVQTTYDMDMAVASLADRGIKNALRRWTEDQGNPVARVNATGILAKIPDQSESATVVATLREDSEVRRLYFESRRYWGSMVFGHDVARVDPYHRKVGKCTFLR
ncbi:helix-turn-helix domain-containing protein [Actinokineospora sp. G85]|uniref:helix-turn-helix domain-containing protein n=1 Tax=Actinokineospora sp. G85 TaxID=3406626 RepID=UPI003C734D18